MECAHLINNNHISYYSNNDENYSTKSNIKIEPSIFQINNNNLIKNQNFLNGIKIQTKYEETNNNQFSLNGENFKIKK